MTKDYYGTKRVTAWPQMKKTGPTRETMVPVEGYAVRYADGYESWSPKEAFEAAYKPIDAMGLAGALAAVMEGHTVTRADPEWTDRGLAWGPGGLNNPKLVAAIGETVINEKGVAISPVMLMGEDIFAEDWMIVP